MLGERNLQAPYKLKKLNFHFQSPVKRLQLATLPFLRCMKLQSYFQSARHSSIKFLLVMIQPYFSNSFAISHYHVQSTGKRARSAFSEHVTNMGTGMNFYTSSARPNLKKKCQSTDSVHSNFIFLEICWTFSRTEQ